MKYKVGKITEWDSETGKPTVKYNHGNIYLVVNSDEPYASRIYELIREAEREKGNKDMPRFLGGFVRLQRKNLEHMEMRRNYENQSDWAKMQDQY